MSPCPKAPRRRSTTATSPSPPSSLRRRSRPTRPKRPQQRPPLRVRKSKAPRRAKAKAKPAPKAKAATRAATKAAIRTATRADPLPRRKRKEPLALLGGRAVSFWLGDTLGGRDADLGRPRKSRRGLLAPPPQCRLHGRRRHRRGARLSSPQEGVPKRASR